MVAADASVGALWLAKLLFLNLNFCFLNRFSLLPISSSYAIVLTTLGAPLFTPYTSKKISRYNRESNPGPLGWQSDVLTVIPYRQWNRTYDNPNLVKLSPILEYYIRSTPIKFYLNSCLPCLHMNTVPLNCDPTSYLDLINLLTLQWMQYVQIPEIKYYTVLVKCAFAIAYNQ